MDSNNLIADIRNNPDRHRHYFGGLERCCTRAGIYYKELEDAHKTYVLAPEGREWGKCSTVLGNCACGKTHK